MSDIDFLKNTLKEQYEIFNNYKNIKHQIESFGITEEGLFVYNEDNNLSNALNLPIDLYTDPTVVVESISEKMEELKNKIKEKWEKFKEKFTKQQEVKLNKFDRMLKDITELEEKIKKGLLNVDEEKGVTGPYFSNTKKIITEAIKFEAELSSNGLIQKTKHGIKWLDLSKFQQKAKDFKVGFAIEKLPSGILKFKAIPGYRYKFYPIPRKESDMKTLGWNENNIKIIIELLKKSYDVFKKNYNALKLRYGVYGENMNVIDNNNNDDLEDILFDESCDADYSLNLMDDLIHRLEQIATSYADDLIYMVKEAS